MPTHSAPHTLLLVLGSLILACQASAADLGSRSADLYQTIDWSLDNSGYSGNAYDVIAAATFTHSSGEKRTTQMYYDGNGKWSFRFNGSRAGSWSFTTSSSHSTLNGHSGTISVASSSTRTGFLVTHGTKFALQRGTDKVGYIPKVFMTNTGGWITDPGYFSSDTVTKARKYAQAAKNDGFNVIYLSMNNHWFKLGAKTSDEHSSTNPDRATFALLETIINTARSEGVRVHFWKWGDVERKWTQVEVGGINGVPDKRLQRYIAARLGPIPGWTMSYGFDLHEWASESQIQAWADNMKNLMAWDHLLWARERYNSELSARSNDYTSDANYSAAISELSKSNGRPVFFERRHGYQRDGFDMTKTRRSFWQFAMAGGAGGWWGYFDRDPVFGSDSGYPSPHQLRTAETFWNGKERLRLDMAPANGLTNGYALASAGKKHYVFYRESASSISLDLSGMSGSQPAVAIDATGSYSEISLGTLDAKAHTISLPKTSDWAIAVGVFGNDTSPSPTAPSAPSSLVASASSSSQINLSWKDNSGNEGGFKVERKTGSSGSWSQIAQLGSNVTSYANTGLSAGTLYVYRVRSYNQVGDSSYSSEASATTSSSGSTTRSFHRAINLAGSALTIDGQSWQGQSASGYSYSGKTFENQTISLNPATDSARAQMIRSCVYDTSGGSNVSVDVTSGDYEVYLYVWEDNNSETFDISLEGSVVVNDYQSGSGGSWQRLGPWKRSISDGAVDIRCSAGAAAALSGIEIWKVETSSSEPAATVITSPAAGVTFSPGQSVTVTGSGNSLSWSIDRNNDGAGDIASGSGSSLTFTVPSDTTADQPIRIRLSGDAGTVEQTHQVVVDGGGSNASVAAEVELDITDSNGWDMGTIVVRNQSDSVGIASVRLVIGSGDFDWIKNFTVSPDLGSNNDGLASPDVTLGFGSGLAAGGSRSGDFDIDHGPGTVTATVTFTDGSTLSGSLVDVGDSDDGDPRRFLWSSSGASGGTSSGIGTIAINFQPASASVPSGWLVDSSKTFGDRGNGHSYGWTSSFDETRDRNSVSDQVADTLNHMQKGGVDRVWELALPDGVYEVGILCGDPGFTDQVNHLMVEGQRLADPDGQDHWDEGTITVSVTDGKLTIKPASDASNAKICGIWVSAAASSNG